MSNLPKGWTNFEIGNLIELNPKNSCSDDATVGFVPMPLLGKTYLDKIAFDLQRWGDVKRGYTQFADGDVLLAKITPCFENGKAGIAENLPNGMGAGSTEYFVCRPIQEILLPKYLLAFFKTENFVNGGALQMTGSVGHKRVPKSYVADTEIPLAPFFEQKRIADKLDTVLTRVDACRERLNRVPLILKRFRQSVLAAATSGKLSEDWHTKMDSKSLCDVNAQFKMQTGRTTLMNVQSAKRQWVLRNPDHNEVGRVKKRVDSYSSKNISTENLPTNWCWAKLEDISILVVDCHNKTAPYEKEGIALVRTTNVRDGQFIWDDLRYVSDETYSYWSKRCTPEAGDIVFTREAPMGEAAIIPNGKKICLGQRTMLIRPLEECVPAKYLLMAILDPKFKERSEKIAVGTGVKHYRVGDVSDLLVPFPSMEEQHEIVRRVEILFAFADRLEARLATARAATDRLTPALLAKAFRGELVPQDPDDEPAAELLKRLAASRNESGAKPARGRAAKANERHETAQEK